MRPMPEQVFCPVCGKAGWSDERKSELGAWPCVTCLDDYRALKALEAC